jgi:hypothetical protein
MSHRSLFSDAEIIDFDSILGDLNALDHLFEFSPATTATSKTPNVGPPVQPRSSGVRTSVAAKGDDPLADFDNCDAVLRGALLELNSIVSTGATDQLISSPDSGVVSVTRSSLCDNGRSSVDVRVHSKGRTDASSVHESNRRTSVTSTSTCGSSELSVKDSCSSPETINSGVSSKQPAKVSQVRRYQV